MNPCIYLAPVLVLSSAFLIGASQTQVFGPQGPPYKPVKPIAIVGGLLIDATGAPPRIDHTVVIEGERITRVGRSDAVEIPNGAQVIDAKEMTVMPGLINSNQHIQLNPLYPAHDVGLTLAELKARWDEAFSRMPRVAFIYLMQGVTAMRQTSGPAKRILPLKQAIDRGEVPGPRLFLGGALLTSEEEFADYVRREGTPPDAVDWVREEFAYAVIKDPDRDTDPFLGQEFNYWKLLMSDEVYDGKNDFSDEELRFIISKAHKHGKIVDVHCGGHNQGLRRMLGFQVDTLEHPFYGHELIDMDIVEGYARKGVIIDTLLTVMVVAAERAADPHRFSETIYAMTLDPGEYRVLMEYRDKLLANWKNPDQPGWALYESRAAESRGELQKRMRTWGYNELQKRMETSKENMRRFIKAGAKFSMGTDTPSFLNFQQEHPNANEMRYMVEMGMTPMQAIEASTRNGAEALGMLEQLGTIEVGKFADVIVVAGNPLQDMRAMRRVYAVIKGGVRYK